jgi:NADP-dependent 3-hydroxy acid dehydrogenase YdfG
MPRPLAQQVVTMVGASSGTGWEPALTLAGRGSSVALVARNKEALDDLGNEVERLRGWPLVIPTDVTHSGAAKSGRAMGSGPSLGRSDCLLAKPRRQQRCSPQLADDRPDSAQL